MQPNSARKVILSVGSPRADLRLNELTGTEWVQGTKSVMFQQGLGAQHPDARIERLHPAPFAYKDAERLIRFFSKSGEVVLDPFMGVGSTLKACALAERFGIGIELNADFCRLARERMRREVGKEEQIAFPSEIIRGDARTLLKRFDDDSLAFILTSPPYWNVLARPRNAEPDLKFRKGSRPYGEDKRDLGCIRSYDEFIEALANCIDGMKRILQPRRYMALVVADIRYKDTLYPLQADLIAELRKRSAVGSRRLVLQGIKILAQNQKRLYPYGFPTTYVPNIHHHYVLIYRNLPVAEKIRKPKPPARC